MGREEILQMLALEEVQAVVRESFVDKEEFDKVNNKREQLLTEKKSIQGKLKTVEEELGTWKGIETKVGELGFNIDEVVESLSKKTGEEDNADEKLKLAQNRLTVQKETYESRIASMTKEHEKQLNEIKEQNQLLTRGWDVEKIENTINAEFDRINVLPKHRAILRQAFVPVAAVEENEDGVRGVLLTNNAGLKTSATDFFDSFAQSEEGKAYIAAPVTTGGGAIGGKGGKHAVDYNAERLKALEKGDSFSSVGLALSEFLKQKR